MNSRLSLFSIKRELLDLKSQGRIQSLTPEVAHRVIVTESVWCGGSSGGGIAHLCWTYPALALGARCEGARGSHRNGPSGTLHK